jgi:hypothetical protein
MTQRIWHAAPDRETLTRVTSPALSSLYKGLPRALARLPLEMYVDAADTYWVGIKGEGFAEHHRWLYAVQPARLQPMRGGLGEVAVNGVPVEKIPGRYAYSDVVQCGSVLRSPNPGSLHSNHGFKNLTDEIDSLASEIENEIEESEEYDSMTELDELAWKRKALIIFQSFDLTGVYASSQSVKLPWDQDMHDLIHHYDLWLANHPEAADMPRDLTLRMYGLGYYVEGQQNSDYDWLDPYDDEPLTGEPSA